MGARWTGKTERQAGRPACADSRVAALEIVGRCDMETVDLDTLRGVDEFIAHRRTIEARITELERQFAGQSYPEAEREEYAALVEARGEVDQRIAELRAREAYVRTIAQDPRNVESEEAALALSARA